MKAAVLFIVAGLVSTSVSGQNERSRALPDFVSLQHAGSIGYMSAGAGYKIFRNKAEMSFHYGYVPERFGGKLHIASGKLLFRTFSMKISPSLTLEPLNTGLMISYHFGSLFASSWPDHRYPEGYYWWKTSVRAHLNAQTVLTMRFGEKAVKSLSVFADYNANELYIVSLFQNVRSLRPGEVVKLGFGIRAGF